MSAAVAVAVVSWNTRELLRRCLASLESEEGAGRCEVWVVDNGSTDGSAEMIRKEFDWVHLIESQRNLGFGPAVNAVAERTDAPWIAPANADIELTDGALGRMLAAGSEPAVGAVAPRLVTPAGTTQHSVHAFPTIGLALLFALGAYRLPGIGDRLCIEGYWDPDRPRAIDWAHGAFLLIRRAAFDEIGGFDPEQWLYAEDIDIHWRLAQQGWEARYVADARVRHEVSASTTQAFGATRTRRHLLATYAWQARRHGIATAWICAAINAVGAGARWLTFWLATRVGIDSRIPAPGRAAVYARSHLTALRSRRALEALSAPPADPAGAGPPSC